MTIATGSQSSTYYVEESTFGDTPTTPAYDMLCVLTNTIGVQKDTLTNDCLTPDRQRKDVRGGNLGVSGDITFNLEYGNFDAMIEAAFMGTWTADVLEVGTRFRSFTIEKHLLNLDTPEYHRFRGCIVNTMSLTAQPNSMINGTFGFIGKDIDSANLTTQVAGSTYNPYTERQSFDSYTGSATIDGVASNVSTELTFNLENGYEPAYVLFDNNTIQPADGKNVMTGTVGVFYEDSTLYQDYLDENEISIAYTLQDPDGNQYQILFPRVKIFNGNPDLSDDGQIQVSYEAEFLFDSVTGTTAQITRVPV